MENLTILDIAKRTEDKKIAVIAEILKKFNPFLDDMHFEECNDGTGHKVTVRKTLPGVYWRKYNEGVESSSSKTAQFRYETGELSGYSEIDRKLIQLSGKELALSEDIAFIEAMSQIHAKALLYGKGVKEDSNIMGMASIYNGKDMSSDYVLDLGGSEGLSSIFFMTHGKHTMYGLYPKGSKAGMTIEPKGIVTVEKPGSKKMEAYRTYYEWDNGFCVNDIRYGGRVKGIATAKLDEIDLRAKMIELLQNAPSLAMGKSAFYVSRKLYTHMYIQTINKTNLALDFIQLQNGVKELAVLGVPVKRADAIVNNEEAI